MSKFKCSNKRCQYEGDFSFHEADHYPLCPRCDSPMFNIDKLVEDELINKMLKNISYYGIQGTFEAIDRTIHNPVQRIKYRQILQKTINKWNLKEK